MNYFIFTETMLYNETTSADYIRSICGMESLKNSTATLDGGLVLNDQSGNESGW